MPLVYVKEPYLANPDFTRIAADRRNFERGVLENDRNFNQNVKESNRNFDLRKGQDLRQQEAHETNQSLRNMQMEQMEAMHPLEVQAQEAQLEYYNTRNDVYQQRVSQDLLKAKQAVHGEVENLLRRGDLVAAQEFLKVARSMDDIGLFNGIEASAEAMKSLWDRDTEALRRNARNQGEAEMIQRESFWKRFQSADPETKKLMQEERINQSQDPMIRKLRTRSYEVLQGFSPQNLVVDPVALWELPLDKDKKEDFADFYSSQLGVEDEEELIEGMGALVLDELLNQGADAERAARIKNAYENNYQQAMRLSKGRWFGKGRKLTDEARKYYGELLRLDASRYAEGTNSPYVNLLERFMFRSPKEAVEYRKDVLESLRENEEGD